MCCLQDGVFGVGTQEKRFDQVVLAAAGAVQRLCEICMCESATCGGDACVVS